MNESNGLQSSLSPSSGPTPSVPMTFGQILDRTYRLVRAHFRLFFGIAAVPAVSVLVMVAAVTSFMLATLWPQIASHTSGVGFFPAGIPPWLPLIVFCIYPFVLVIYALYMPAAAFAATQADLGLTVSFRQAYGVAWSRFGRSLWLMILCILYIVVPIVVIGALIAVGTLLISHSAGSGAGPASAFLLIPLLVLLYIGILVYCVLIMLRFAVAYPACVEENLSAWKALQRSASLTRGAKGRIFLLMLVIYAIVYAAELVCILVLVAVGALAALAAMSVHVTVGSSAFCILVGLGVLGYLLILMACILFSYAAFTAALAVLYHDQRRRKDTLASTPAQA